MRTLVAWYCSSMTKRQKISELKPGQTARVGLYIKWNGRKYYILSITFQGV